MHRVFIAIKVPSFDIKQIYQELKSVGTKITTVDPERFHFTLHFFGDISTEQIEEIKVEMNNIVLDKFRISLAGTGIIPPRGRAKVLYIKLNEGMNGVIEVANTVKNMVRSLGYKPDKRPYLPHLTVVRIRDKYKLDKLIKKWNEYSTYRFDEFEANEIHLIKSILTPTGPVYETLHKVIL